MKTVRKSVAAVCLLALVLQLFAVLPNASADTEQAYQLVSAVEAGHTYVIVADGAYALNDQSASYQYNNNSYPTLGSTAVSIEDGVITSEVTEDMLWRVDTAVDVSAAANGEAQFFLRNHNEKLLNRGSSSGTGYAPLSVGEINPQKTQYSTWSIHTRTDGSFTVYANSYQTTDDFFALSGTESYFNAPGKSPNNYDFNNNGSSIRFYELKDTEPDPDPSDTTEPTNSTETTEPEEPTEPDSSAYDVVFLSDLHNGVGGYHGLIQMMSELSAEGQSPRVLSHGGDYVEDDKGGQVDWQTDVYDKITSIESGAFPDAERVYTMGNHDWETGTFGGAADKETAFFNMFGFPRCGQVYSDDEMVIYMIGAQSANTGAGGAEAFKTEDIEAFDQYLTSMEGTTKVVFLQTHWPAHSSYNWKQRNVANSQQLIQVINSHSENMDIVWIWGHNHYDDTMRFKVLKPGSEIIYAADSNSTWNNPRNPQTIEIGFIYANASCMNDMKTNGTYSTGDMRGPAACLSVAIESDTITFTYNRITKVNNEWTFSHNADITYDNHNNYTISNPATVVVVRKVPAHTHTFEDELVVPPTCTEGGYTIQKCTYPRCSATKIVDEKLPLGHSWDEGVVIPATCSEQGYTLWTCTVCSETEQTDFTETSEHTWAPGGEVAPTCTEYGYKVRICAVCNTEDHYAFVPATGHTWIDVSTYAATCTVGAYTLQNCAVCNAENQDFTSDPLGHDWDEVVTIPASTTCAGEKECTCRRCAETKTEAIPRLPGIGPVDIDFTKLEDVEKYVIVGQNSAAVEEGTGVGLVCTEDSIAADPAAPKDLIKVPVSADWTATIKFRMEQNHVSQDLHSRFAFLAAEGADYQNLVGICGSDAFLEDYLCRNGEAEDPSVSEAGFQKNTAYWLRLQKEGDTYKGSWSENGVTFTELFSLENTGIEAEYLLFDAYSTGDTTETWTITLKSLTFRDVDASVTAWKKAESIEFGKTYVIVAEGAWAMTNADVQAKETYADSTTTRGAVPVVIEDDTILGNVTDDMKWTFSEYTGQNARDGQTQYFLKDYSGKYLRRGSMSKRNAALILDNGEMLTPANRRYYAWSFKAYDGMDATYAMYVNSERAYNIDYPGRVGGNANGFDIPGGLNKRTDADPFGFMNDAACSKITLYTETALLDLLPLMNAIHEAKALDPNLYTEESAAMLAEAIAAAEASLSSVGSDEEVQAAVSALNEAMGALQWKQAFRFDDVQDEEAFYYNAIYWAYGTDPQITNGITDTTFGTNKSCSRGHVVTFLWRAAGCPEPTNMETPFTDVDPESFCGKAVAWAVEKGITNGVSSTQFEPNTRCTRAQIVTFLWRFAGEPAPASRKTPFKDVPSGSCYAEPIAWAVENGITTGRSETRFAPKAMCTRAEIVTFLWRTEGCPNP